MLVGVECWCTFVQSVSSCVRSIRVCTVFHSLVQVEGYVWSRVEGSPTMVECLFEARDVHAAATHVLGARHLRHQHVPVAPHSLHQPQVPVHALHRHSHVFKSHTVVWGVARLRVTPPVTSPTLSGGAHWRTISSATCRLTIQP